MILPESQGDIFSIEFPIFVSNKTLSGVENVSCFHITIRH